MTPKLLQDAIALRDAHLDSIPRDTDQAAAVKDRIQAAVSNVNDARNKDNEPPLSTSDYLIARASEADFSPPRPDTTIAFWSHGVQRDDLPPEIDHASAPDLLSFRYVAQAWANEQNKLDEGSAQVLESTPGGSELDSYHLFEQPVRTALWGRSADREGTRVSGAVWDGASAQYAAAASSKVAVFASDLAPWTILYKTEMSRLRNDPNVGLDNIHFMVDPSQERLEGLPPETQALLSDDRVRAQAHYFPYDETDPKIGPEWRAGYLDLEKLKANSSVEGQRAAVLEVCARVAALDGRDADVKQLTEEVAALRVAEATAAKSNAAEASMPTGPTAEATTPTGPTGPTAEVTTPAGPTPPP
ncbi:hypothetical protein, partial [Streptomyces sp. H27-D2]|uniref:hypothetical protein n=1 Tax=Streptomyces sp. H27-D2 TaxID=3046304 RepID=UPI002DBFCDCA